MALEKIVEYCQELYEDLDFTSVRQWKEAGENRKVIGHMPVYVPREMIHAAGMLPVGILGGGDQLDVIHGDAYYQSYICRIPRSTIELSVTGRLDCLDGMLQVQGQARSLFRCAAKLRPGCRRRILHA
jgi:benzoyl-CoA reductase subunit C